MLSKFKLSTHYKRKNYKVHITKLIKYFYLHLVNLSAQFTLLKPIQ